VAITYKGAATEVPELKGAACPDLVYPNYQDWGFAQVQLDKKSFATAQSSLSKVEDPLLRSMLWQSLWDGVRSAQLPLNDFLKTALANAPAEKDYTLLGNIVDKVRASKGYLEAQGPSAYQTKVGVQLEQMAFAATRSATDSNFQRRWFSTYVGLASSPAALRQLADILNGKLVVKGLNVSQDVRWEIIRRLSRMAYPGSEALVVAEQARDKSDSGQQAAIAATVVRPEGKVKTEWATTIADLQTKLPFSKVRTAMGSMYPPEQSALNELTAQQRLDTLGAVDKAAGPVYMRAYAASMIPATCTPASVQRLDAAIAKLPELSNGTRRALLVTRQEDARCVAIKQAMTAH
jgi:aminopeptidase N